MCNQHKVGNAATYLSWVYHTAISVKTKRCIMCTAIYSPFITKWPHCVPDVIGHQRNKSLATNGLFTLDKIRHRQVAQLHLIVHPFAITITTMPAITAWWYLWCFFGGAPCRLLIIFAPFPWRETVNKFKRRLKMMNIYYNIECAKSYISS